jgi:hypothetical protein
MNMNEMQIINGRIDGVEQMIGSTNKTVHSMNDNVKKMVILLQGNDFDKNDNGMIGEVTELRKRVARLEKFKDRMFWVILTAATVTGLSIPQLVEWIKKAFAHG